MTMQPYATAGVPSDATGTYPALAGYVPMETGRRVSIALVDGLIGLVFYGAMMGVVFASGRNSAVGGGIVLVLALVWLGVELWALFAKSSRLAGVLMKATYVDVQTGQRAGGKVFGKFLLAGLLGALTFGIAPLVMYFATVLEPLKRNWFDRTLGLMLVDHRVGRSPGEPPVAAPVSTLAPPPPVSAVQFPGASYGGATPYAPQFPPASSFPSSGLGSPTGVADPYAAQVGQPPASPGQPPAVPRQPPAAPASPSAAPTWQLTPPPLVQPVAEEGGLITATPYSSFAPPSDASAPPATPSATPAPHVVVREMRSVDADEADRTMLAADSALLGAVAPGAHATLDDGSVLALTPPSVLGRNPVAPGSHPDAVPHAVNDQLASKTHLLLGHDDRGAWVIDLHSTNGVQVIRAADASAQKIEPGRKVHLPVDSRVLFAQRTVTIN